MDDEPEMAADTEEGLLRSWAETQGCTAPGRSTEVGRGDSLLVPVLLELLVLPLEKRHGGREDECQDSTKNMQKNVSHSLKLASSSRSKAFRLISYTAR